MSKTGIHSTDGMLSLAFLHLPISFTIFSYLIVPYSIFSYLFASFPILSSPNQTAKQTPNPKTNPKQTLPKNTPLNLLLVDEKPHKKQTKTKTNYATSL
jgi:hypothetical protein